MAMAWAFPTAHTQVVAGRVNRESGEVQPLDIGAAILAQCWPRGSTSDQPPMRLMMTMRGMTADRMFKNGASHGRVGPARDDRHRHA